MTNEEKAAMKWAEHGHMDAHNVNVSYQPMQLALKTLAALVRKLQAKNEALKAMQNPHAPDGRHLGQACLKHDLTGCGCGRCLDEAMSLLDKARKVLEIELDDVCKMPERCRDSICVQHRLRLENTIALLSPSKAGKDAGSGEAR